MSPGSITPEQWLDSLPVVAAADVQNGKYYLYRGQAPGITNPVVRIDSSVISLVANLPDSYNYWYFVTENNVFRRKTVQNANDTLNFIKESCGMSRGNAIRSSSRMTKDMISGILATV